MKEIYLYDMTDEEIKELRKESGYSPISEEKGKRKLKVFREYLRKKGIICEDYNLEVYQSNSFGWFIDWNFRIYNPHMEGDDDYCYKVVNFLTI